MLDIPTHSGLGVHDPEDDEGRTSSEMVGVYFPLKAKAKYQLNRELIADHYLYEKVIGLRKSNGAAKIASVRPIHQHIIAAHLSGERHVNIALQLGVSLGTVHRVVNDPVFTNLVDRFRDGFTAELEAMFPLVISAIRKGLESKKVTENLFAAKQWASLTGKGETTRGDTNINLTLVQEARRKLVGVLTPYIDVTPDAPE